MLENCHSASATEELVFAGVTVIRQLLIVHGYKFYNHGYDAFKKASEEVLASLSLPATFITAKTPGEQNPETTA